MRCSTCQLPNRQPGANSEQFEFYPAGTLVGSDCPGAKEPARYAKRGKKKAKA
jgi:hypothetical protein